VYEMCDELDALLTGNITDTVHDLIINYGLCLQAI